MTLFNGLIIETHKGSHGKFEAPWDQWDGGRVKIENVFLLDEFLEWVYGKR